MMLLGIDLTCKQTHNAGTKPQMLLAVTIMFPSCMCRVRRLEVSQDGDDEEERPNGKHRSKSMQQEKEEARAHRRALGQAREEVGRLGQLVRLADHMMVGALMSLTIDSSAELLQTLSMPRDKGDKGVFLNVLGMVPGDIDFDPQEPEVGRCMNNPLRSRRIPVMPRWHCCNTECVLRQKTTGEIHDGPDAGEHADLGCFSTTSPLSLRLPAPLR